MPIDDVLEPGASPTEAGKAMRRAAKLFNERLTLIATLFNNISVTVFITTAITPYMSGQTESPVRALGIGLFFALVLRALGQLVLAAWKGED